MSDNGAVDPKPKRRGPPIRWTDARIRAVAKKILAYAHEAFERKSEARINAAGNAVIVPPDFPTVGECLKKYRLNSSMVYGLAKDYPELSSAIKKIKDAQEHILANYTLKGSYAQVFAIFMAKNILGWKDEQKGPVVDQSQHNHITLIHPPERQSKTDANRITALSI